MYFASHGRAFRVYKVVDAGRKLIASQKSSVTTSEGSFLQVVESTMIDEMEANC